MASLDDLRIAVTTTIDALNRKHASAQRPFEDADAVLDRPLVGRRTRTDGIGQRVEM